LWRVIRTHGASIARLLQGSLPISTRTVKSVYAVAVGVQVMGLGRPIESASADESPLSPKMS